jgi:hypothetical protein
MLSTERTKVGTLASLCVATAAASTRNGVRECLSSVRCPHRLWQPVSELPACSVWVLERQAQIRGVATVQAPQRAAIIEMTVVVPALSTGTIAASTRAVVTISPSTGWANR